MPTPSRFDRGSYPTRGVGHPPPELRKLYSQGFEALRGRLRTSRDEMEQQVEGFLEVCETAYLTPLETRKEKWRFRDRACVEGVIDDAFRLIAGALEHGLCTQPVQLWLDLTALVSILATGAISAPSVDFTWRSMVVLPLKREFALQFRHDAAPSDEGDHWEMVTECDQALAVLAALARGDLPKISQATESMLSPNSEYHDFAAPKLVDDSVAACTGGVLKVNTDTAEGEVQPNLVEMKPDVRGSREQLSLGGEWLTPTTKADMANRLGNIGIRKLTSILKVYELRKAGNRQLWTVRLDTMPPSLRKKLER